MSLLCIATASFGTLYKVRGICFWSRIEAGNDEQRFCTQPAAYLDLFAFCASFHWPIYRPAERNRSHVVYAEELGVMVALAMDVELLISGR